MNDASVASDAPALALENIVAGIGPLTILDGVTLELRQREVVAVLGANGAGKTTLLRTIAGLLAPRSGRISLFGEPIEGRPAHLITRAGIGHVPSGRELFPGSRSPIISSSAAASRRPAAGASFARASSPCSPSSASGSGSAPARSPEASSRCWRSRAP